MRSSASAIWSRVSGGGGGSLSGWGEVGGKVGRDGGSVGGGFVFLERSSEPHSHPIAFPGVGDEKKKHYSLEFALWGPKDSRG